MEITEPAADRMKRREGGAKSDVIVYRSMNRNGHDHPVTWRREGSQGTSEGLRMRLWRLFKVKTALGRSNHSIYPPPSFCF